MKNNLKIGLILLVATTTMAFTTISEKEINVKESKILWKGYKVTGEHDGSIQLKEGVLKFEGNTLRGGSFVVDMTTITNHDLKGEYKGKLEGHLKSDDFFGVEKHPSAKLQFTNVENKGDHYVVIADLTIKNMTNSVTFNMMVDDNAANASLKIDRSKFDVRFGSPSFFNDLKDKAIYDEFDLNVSLSF